MYKKGDLVLDLILTEPVTFMTYVSKEDGIVVLKQDRYNKIIFKGS